LSACASICPLCGTACTPCCIYCVLFCTPPPPYLLLLLAARRLCGDRHSPPQAPLAGISCAASAGSWQFPAEFVVCEWELAASVVVRVCQVSPVSVVGPHGVVPCNFERMQSITPVFIAHQSHPCSYTPRANIANSCSSQQQADAVTCPLELLAAECCCLLLLQMAEL
jgi:hypothetical protein